MAARRDADQRLDWTTAAERNTLEAGILDSTLSPAVFHASLMEVDDDLRGMLLVDRQRTVRAIALHLLMRIRPHILFRRPAEEVSLQESVEAFVDAILNVPERVLCDFAQEEAAPRGAATDFISKTLFQCLTGSVHATDPGEPNLSGDR